MNAPATQPLRDEHRELLPHIERLREVASEVGTADIVPLRADVAEVYEFLSSHLIPHAMAEDEALYPVVARVLGSPRATDTMRRDHVSVGRLVAELGTLRTQLAGTALAAQTATELRRILYGLYELVSTHFAKEEEIYLPLLDERLTSEEAAEMFTNMERAAERAKAAAR